jgi:hypothetical protein
MNLHGSGDLAPDQVRAMCEKLSAKIARYRWFTAQIFCSSYKTHRIEELIKDLEQIRGSMQR